MASFRSSMLTADENTTDFIVHLAARISTLLLVFHSVLLGFSSTAIKRSIKPPAFFHGWLFSFQAVEDSVLDTTLAQPRAPLGSFCFLSP